MTPTFAKVTGAVALALVGALVAVFSFSAVEYRYECSGSLASGGTTRPLTLFLKIDKYRWWVGLWSDSDGSVWIEIPREAVDYIGDVVEVGDQLQLYGPNREMKGHFSTLSKATSLKLVGGFFDGTCKKVDA